MSNACYIGDRFKVLEDYFDFKKGEVCKCVNTGDYWVELQHKDDLEYTGIFYYSHNTRTNQVVRVGNDDEKETEAIVRQAFREYDESVGARTQTAWQIWRDAVEWCNRQAEK